MLRARLSILVVAILVGLGLVSPASASTGGTPDGETHPNVGLIAFYGFVAARVGGGTIPRALLEATGVALIGARLIAIKALIH